MKVTVSIITRNRALQLKRCLLSLVKQQQPADEVIVCDNNSTDNTQKVIAQFSQKLPITYVSEERVGIPFARNTSLKHVTGDVVAFIDDDCTADPEWLKVISKAFSNPSTGVVIGLSQPHTRNIASIIEQLFYERWLTQIQGNLSAPSKVTEGRLCDFKNLAAHASLLTSFSFSTSAPFGEVGDEDVEAGIRLLSDQHTHWLYPQMKVQHQYSTSLWHALKRNYLSGVSKHLLKKEVGVDRDMYQQQSNHFDWLQAISQYLSLTSPRVLLLAPSILLYVCAGKAGQLAAQLYSILGHSYTLPARK